MAKLSSYRGITGCIRLTERLIRERVEIDETWIAGQIKDLDARTIAEVVANVKERLG